jgi:hypothetical protein
MRTCNTTRSRFRGTGLTAILAGALFTACGSSPAAVETVETPTAVHLTVIAAAQQSDVQEARRLVIRDRETWARIWAELQGPQTTPVALPEADFARELVLVAALGRKPTSGYSVEFGTIRTDGDALEVQVKKEAPGLKCGTAQVLTSPYAVAKTARTDDPVKFIELETTRNCE